MVERWRSAAGLSDVELPGARHRLERLPQTHADAREPGLFSCQFDSGSSARPPWRPYRTHVRRGRRRRVGYDNSARRDPITHRVGSGRATGQQYRKYCGSRKRQELFHGGLFNARLEAAERATLHVVAPSSRTCSADARQRRLPRHARARGLRGLLSSAGPRGIQCAVLGMNQLALVECQTVAFQ